MTELCPYQLISPVSAGENADLLADENKKDGIRRIQALLADWLRMENVVILAAAGCSVGAGGRLMAGPKTNNLECLVLDAVENCATRQGSAGNRRMEENQSFWLGQFRGLPRLSLQRIQPDRRRQIAY
jgi:hypothetical protein